MSESLRWGVIGTGAIAAAWVEDMGMTDSGSVVAVGSRTLETAERFADRLGIPNRHASYEALVADPDVNAVYVATPTPCTAPAPSWRCAQASRRWSRSRSRSTPRRPRSSSRSRGRRVSS